MFRVDRARFVGFRLYSGTACLRQQAEVTLDFGKRNEIILRSLNRFYPSVSTLARPTATIHEFGAKYKDIYEDQPHVIEVLRGKIKSVRVAGKNMCFVNVTALHAELQLILNFKVMHKAQHHVDTELTSEAFQASIQNLRPGDHIQAVGFPGLSQRQRTLSLKCISPAQTLAPAQLPVPPRLVDPVKRKQNRVLDYLVNGHQALVVRHRTVKAIRRFLDAREFLEVETPMMSAQSNGAAAEPFETRSKALHQKLQLRIAPELWLKRLVVAGCERVYEIGKVFRNEGIDATHNAEFTTLEFYQAYASMEDLITMSEQLYRYVLEDAQTLAAARLLQEFSENRFCFRRVEFLATLSRETGVEFEKLDLQDAGAMRQALQQRGLDAPSECASPQQMLNYLCGKYIEDKYCQGSLPTLIFHHPTVMSPLAKGNTADNMKTSKRFEVFIRGKEYINAYEEENCPQQQLAKFKAQQAARATYGDQESLQIDENYVDAMKWGMPPIGGFGLGIDRLCMLLTDSKRIEEVLSFGSLDDVNRQ
ncbi:LAMI_0C08680g1_1 [Lachancea mirantina]|uniref:lysine--tRNA ligase n=1 Tax=Lachancea mirantina TaxID=1230905 RepID=A0A1G4J511_9SACH|nr:LAMI_0C08680g1_1 [Lachancea mirantina]